MKTMIFPMVLLMLLSMEVTAQKKKDKKRAGYTNDDYEITCAGIGVEGSKLISISGFGKNPEEAMRSAKKNAMHGILFRGAFGDAGGCKGVKALVEDANAQEKHEPYFSAFFQSGGNYLNYVSFANQASRQVVKVDKKTYKVTIVASILYDKLRKDLEDADIIKKLTHGF